MANGGILTPPVISRLPLGLLRFLGIQSGGLYPQSLNSGLQTTLETLDLLAVNHREFLTQTQNGIAAVGPLTFSTFAVPSGVGGGAAPEVWYVRGVSARITLGAAENWSGQLFYQPREAGGAVTAIWPLHPFRTFGGPVAQSVGSWEGTVGAGLWMGPGDILGIDTQALTGTVDTTLSGHITRFGT